MAKKVEELVESKIQDIVQGLGFDIVEVEYCKKTDGMNLTVYIDSPQGISLDDCEKVHRMIDKPIEEVNPSDDNPYILNVSSCGIDRPVKNEKDFLRNKGKEVTVKLFAPDANKNKFYVGNLVQFDKDIAIVCDGVVKKFNKSEVALVTPVIKF